MNDEFGTRNDEFRIQAAIPSSSFTIHRFSQAEACFQQALDLARQRREKSLELRAAMSLARVWQKQGKKIRAHQLLHEVYGWFTEGFDTADLQQAKALLSALS